MTILTNLSMITSIIHNNIEAAEGDPQEITGVLHPEEESLSEKAVETRCREFAAGRILAHRVLAKWGLKNYALMSGANREPLWPQGFVGSITHTSGYCAVVAGRRQDFDSLGIDVERVERVHQDIWPAVCTPQELDFLNCLPISERQQYAALFFSAKESFYKCQYPLTQQWLEFGDVTIQPLADQKCFEIKLHKDIIPNLGKDSWLQGRYCFNLGYVATAMTMSSWKEGMNV